MVANAGNFSPYWFPCFIQLALIRSEHIKFIQQHVRGTESHRKTRRFDEEFLLVMSAIFYLPVSLMINVYLDQMAGRRNRQRIIGINIVNRKYKNHCK